MQINCVLPTRLRVMGSNAIPCVILDTQGHFSFAICQPPRNGFILEFSPLHLQILGMFNQREDKNHNCWSENLYLKGLVFSQKTSLNFGTYVEEWMRAAKMCSSRREDITI